MQYFLGVLFERYLSKRDDAMDIWERAIKDSAKAVKGTGLFNARNEVVHDLCNLYIEKISQLGKDSPVAAKYFKKVKDIGCGSTIPQAISACCTGCWAKMSKQKSVFAVESRRASTF